ncbi:C4-dicarboxylate transporter DcuC [Carnobacterium maltaromaticum]|jgi:DcuC family C4-dicarboxylate transporter|uniref:Transporter, anaerobic C4-dicarboxylate uptake C family protein n=1 Tax=Carnobacterium maltaromaticum LMA28 TaxID=1234679 RepID=K8E3L0_CARML|nr:C4-dicarboxylate transporter DcuC [Carnobacterium maltaromaticum]AOA01713.1 C4-dicarboxylate ABC transporter [Carnobacterium maltaromaticum]KRN64854.1 transporter, anaerobic C4-dicarboxylate uptake C family [Carnobacterium maltaromaticum DSM 20342]MCI1820019.1 C4-dicarboxylate transporter DcuC [Carnobacterium maltaromaticum]CCO10809.1 transporter, anaerobic C4-dicarboxylate uptake C family protein [Carnobacterium maltaromaticum LMA28]
MIEIFLVILVLGVVAYLIIKNYNPILTLISGGLVLLACAVILGHPLYPAGEGTGLGVFDIFMKFKDTIIGQVQSAGLVIMILFGYSGYMNKIGANQVAVNLLVKPMMKIKAKALFVPIIFLIGNLMSLVIPSASSLAIILMSILYPMLQGIGISSLTAAGVIAMTATIMPTPLGADNVIAAETLGYDLLNYVMWNAKISIPTLFIIAVAHYFWQKYCDKKEGASAFIEMDQAKLEKIEESNTPTFYAILPLMPLLLILIVGIMSIVIKGITMDIFVLTMIAFFIAVLIETCRYRSFKTVQLSAVEMFNGMGQGFSRVVMLVVGGSLFTTAIQSLGVIDNLLSSVESSTSAGIVTMFIFSGATTLFGILSGGGLAMFYAVIELIPNIADKAGVDGILITLPMQMIANLARTISPVAAVVMIVASTVGVSPVRVLKRTSVPTIVGIVSVIVLSLLILPY